MPNAFIPTPDRTYPIGLLECGFMQINGFGSGPEGTFHQSPAPSAGRMGSNGGGSVLKGRFIRFPGMYVRVVMFAIPAATPI